VYVKAAYLDLSYALLAEAYLKDAEAYVKQMKNGLLLEMDVSLQCL
jgi:hypothetical protein